MDYTIRIAGEAGQGIQTIGGVLSDTLLRSGFYVFSCQDYMSRIRGGHNFFTIRFSDAPVMASRKGVDLLVALNLEGIQNHRDLLTERGMILYDPEATGETFEAEEVLAVPLRKLAVQEGKNPITENTVATAAVIGMLGMDMKVLEEVITETFRRKGEEVVQNNLRAARAGYNYAVQKCLRCGFVVPPVSNPKGLLLNGNEAIALGAIASGCRFYSAYPMTPSTGILNFMASRATRYGIVVEQAEDEIGAINMAIGASFAGVRAMTGSSGGGFALMVEGLSLAAMTETPIVIAEVQRPGPATGLPTRTEQADLLFVLYTGHGEFPRVVFAPGSPEQAFYLTNKAFDLAERFQVPAFVLSDQYLADSRWTIQPLNPERVLYRDYRLKGEELRSLKQYLRHAFTDTGVSPLAVPGDTEHLVVTDSDEHDEEGHITEDALIRQRMVQKRVFRKLPLLKKEISPPTIYGSDRPEVLLLCWGSTYGLVKETVDTLSDRYSIAMMHFSELYPFPEHSGQTWFSILQNARRCISVEQNATNQFCKLLRSETSFHVKEHINRYDGRPFTVDELTEHVQKTLEGHK